MRIRPDLVGGEGAADTELMRLLPGWIAKRGAEGLFCAASRDGLGLAIKIADGNGRVFKPALAAFGTRLGLPLEEFAEVPILNTQGEQVGAFVPC
jgi:L-asparaginase II